MMSHIFISYSRDDSECAYKIQRQLEAQGFKIWIDKTSILAGAPFPNEILSAIRESAVVLILWSANAAKSHYVDKEIQEAINQQMKRSIPVIPIWLDGHKLDPRLDMLNAISFDICSNASVDTLINKLPVDIRRQLGRQLQKFDPDKSLNQLIRRKGSGLVTIPYLKSWFCTAWLVADGATIIAKHMGQGTNKPFICVVPQFLGDTGDTTIEQVYQSIHNQLDGQAFVCLHIKPNLPGKILININEHGQTLDAIQTTYEAVFKLVNGNRALATLKIFTPMMAALSGSIGHVFDSFWHIQEYHFERQHNTYYLLFDSHDL